MISFKARASRAGVSASDSESNGTRNAESRSLAATAAASMSGSEFSSRMSTCSATVRCLVKCSVMVISFPPVDGVLPVCEFVAIAGHRVEFRHELVDPVGIADQVGGLGHFPALREEPSTVRDLSHFGDPVPRAEILSRERVQRGGQLREEEPLLGGLEVREDLLHEFEADGGVADLV